MNGRFAVLGLPASGKTTFLAALWHLVAAEEVQCRLKLDHYEGDDTYLNLISGQWRTFTKLERTSQVGDTDVTLHLVDSATGEKGEAFFPDIAGEAFDNQVDNRRCKTNFLENVAQSDGLMLFIHAEPKEDGMGVLELEERLPNVEDVDPPEPAAADAVAKPEAAAPEMTSDAHASEATSVQPASVAKEWESKDIQPQVRIVQILMDLLRFPFEARPRRIAVILSAWDLVSDLKIAPELWFSSNFQLVHQYFTGNADLFEFEVFGVSAQGVSLTDPAAIDEAAKLNSSERITIIRGTDISHDISMPLVWLIDRSER